MPKPAREDVLATGIVWFHMYCGAGIRRLVEVLARLFERTHSGVRLNIAYAGWRFRLAGYLTVSQIGLDQAILPSASVTLR